MPSERMDLTRTAMPDDLVSREAESLFDHGDLERTTICAEDVAALLVELLDRRKAMAAPRSVGGLDALRKWIVQEAARNRQQDARMNDPDDTVFVFTANCLDRVRDQIDALLSSPSSEDVGRWASIETAPQDGAYILASGWIDNDPEKGYFNPVCVAWDDSSRYWVEEREHYWLGFPFRIWASCPMPSAPPLSNVQGVGE